MMSKRDFARKSVILHNMILKKFHAKMDLVFDGRVITQEMAYDSIDKSLRKKFDVCEDYTRYRTFELVADEIRMKYSSEEISKFCVAEAGVFKGDFAWIINEKFPECRMYLYDTFEGFDQGDMMDEVNYSYTKGSKLKHYEDLFGDASESPEERMGIVKDKLKYKNQCVFRKGYFPVTAIEEREKQWIFVSLDMDLYQPIKEGIKFFWPNMMTGGYMFIHDYNNKDFAGIKKAVSEAEKEFGKIYKVPVSDQGGTIILCK